MFSCICLRKREQCCKPKIGGETQVPTSFHPNQERIKFSTGQCVKEVLCDSAPTLSCTEFNTGQCVKEVLCDSAPTNSCHLLLRWAWLYFKTLNLDERSL